MQPASRLHGPKRKVQELLRGNLSNSQRDRETSVKTAYVQIVHARHAGHTEETRPLCLIGSALRVSDSFGGGCDLYTARHQFNRATCGMTNLVRWHGLRTVGQMQGPMILGVLLREILIELPR